MLLTDLTVASSPPAALPLTRQTMDFNSARASVSKVASWATLIFGAILALKLAGFAPSGIPRDANFWMACCIAAMALR